MFTMATYQGLKNDPGSRILFSNRLANMDDLHKLVLDGNVAFIALDTEHVPLDSQTNRILHQVGLAYLPITSTSMMPDSSTIMMPDSSLLCRPRLGDFYDKYQLQCLTINIDLSEQTQRDLLRFQGHIPKRRVSRFGHERTVKLEDLETAIIEFIQSCGISSHRTKLVLTGFEMTAEWNYFSRDFPRLMPYFASWIDMRDVGKDIASARSLPGRVAILQTFGYSWKDIKGSNENGSADNAGEDAVSTLAMANAFFNRENQDRFRGQLAQKSTENPPKPAMTDEMKGKRRLREIQQRERLEEGEFASIEESFLESLS
ncbi:hypothetical protein GGR52DRAFT_26287 [Hypoxylon sp. FL1284]|nr:hypothetical protein GGR52DRAFT_26287 [Hypoxylon sp. FL1284]